jgi:hypothetical protein
MGVFVEYANQLASMKSRFEEPLPRFRIYREADLFVFEPCSTEEIETPSELLSRLFELDLPIVGWD